MMTISPIAHFHSPLTSKFGIPRQSGIADSLHGTIVFTPEYRNADALRGLEDFDFLWILWGFSENIHSAKHATVRPPRLGGNTRIGVFATRSPFRPNNIGLSSVRIADIQIATPDGPVIEVVGADLMDGTPIYDIKPYLPEFDSHPEAKAGFVNSNEWQPLEVKFLPTADISRFTPTDVNTITQLLSQDPRPHYHSSPDRLYGMTYKGYDIHFRVEGGKVIVEKIES